MHQNNYRRGNKMKLKDVLNDGKLNLSFEVFPPKTSDKFESVEKAVMEIAKLKPPFMSVTYGAGGGTSEYTLELAKRIQEENGVLTLAHLTCVSSTKETVKQRIEEYHNAGIENIMALRGDLLPEMKAEDSGKWDYVHAADLIREIKETGYDFCIGGACYPEIHPESKNQKEDIRYLKEKVDCGCDFLTTQMLFDNNVFYNFMYKLREAGVTVPVVAGIMPITNSKQIERALKLSGCYVPQRFKSIVDRFGDDAEAMKQAGIAYATEQVVDLFSNNITNVHIYSMNNIDVAQKIQASVSKILGKSFTCSSDSYIKVR